MEGRVGTPEEQQDSTSVLKRLEAKKILEIQKKVGVSLSLPDDRVEEKLVHMEEDDVQMVSDYYFHF